MQTVPEQLDADVTQLVQVFSLAGPGTGGGLTHSVSHQQWTATHNSLLILPVGLSITVTHSSKLFILFIYCKYCAKIIQIIL